MKIVYGEESCDPVNELRRRYVSGLRALEDCDREALTGIMPELERYYEMAKTASFKDGKTLDWKAFEYTVNQMRIFCSSTVPEMRVRKATAQITVDGVITPDEWQHALDVMLRC